MTHWYIINWINNIWVLIKFFSQKITRIILMPDSKERTRCLHEHHGKLIMLYVKNYHTINNWQQLIIDRSFLSELLLISRVTVHQRGHDEIYLFTSVASVMSRIFWHNLEAKLRREDRRTIHQDDGNFTTGMENPITQSDAYDARATRVHACANS